jgi:hypothetical protein
MNEPAISPAIIFSDSAIREAKGKLTLTGVFHSIRASKIPFTSPPCFATAFVTNMSGRIKDLPVTLNIEDCEGNILSSAIGRINSIAEISLKQVAEISFPIPPTVFKAEGDYKAVVLVDGERIGCRVFNVGLGYPRRSEAAIAFSASTGERAGVLPASNVDRREPAPTPPAPCSRIGNTSVTAEFVQTDYAVLESAASVP